MNGGNHSMTQKIYWDNETTEYMAEVLQCEELVEGGYDVRLNATPLSFWS